MTVWQSGDRVLARWEPAFLYVGTLEQVSMDKALIDFDDGDAGWVELSAVQPLLLKVRQRVMSRRNMGPRFFHGEIREIDGEQVLIDFDDGKEEWATVGSLRIPCEPVGRGAEQVRATSHYAYLERMQTGDRVWALWNNRAFFAGTVDELLDREAHVQFDDGDEAWVQLPDVSPLDLIVGMFVMCRRRSDRQFFPGNIADTEGDRVLVRFDAGGEEWTTAAALALPPYAFQPPPISQPGPTTTFQVGWNQRVVLIVGALIVAATAAVFFWLGGR